MSEYSDRIQDRELDPITAIALAQEIARELSLERLLDRLLEILRQTTKARRICLLETQGDRWLLIAANDMGAN